MAQGAPASSTPPLLQQWLEGLRHHRPCLRRNNSSRGSGIIDPVFVTTIAQGALTSSTPSPPPQQRLKGSGIIDTASAVAMARGAPASSIRLRRSNGSRGSDSIDPASATATTQDKLRHHLRHHRLLRHELDIIINSFNHVPSFPHKHQPRGARGAPADQSS
jgi:hypothetical protein